MKTDPPTNFAGRPEESIFPLLTIHDVSLRRKTGFTPFDNGAMVAAP